MSGSTIVIVLCGVVVTGAFLWALLYLTQDSNEPPVVCSTIPFLSPVLGIVRWSMDFYPYMRERHRNLPIYTLRLPGVRIYVVNSLHLIPVVQRQWRTLIFAPIQVKAAQAAMGVGKDAIEILNRDLVTEHGFINGLVKATHPTMSSGPGLDALNAKAFEVFDEALKGLECTEHVKMYEWVGKVIIRATTDAVYGPANPMRDVGNLEAWHKYHPALMYMMLDILPQSLFFSKAVAAREHLTRSFAKYYADGSYTQGSAYIQRFVGHCIEHKLPDSEIPRLLLGTVFNNVANTIPAAFWVLYRIVSEPGILQECRAEVRQAVHDNPDGSATIDLGSVLNECPILRSTYQEVFRYHGIANSVRVVAEDHMLDNRYLLKKGGLIMMSARAQHTDPAVWGANVEGFYHKRFVKTQPTHKQFNPVAFRGFGGGATLCPGRHFATSEILMLAAMMVLRYDVRPKTKHWVLPTTGKSSQAEAVEQPDFDIEVEFVRRKDAWEKIELGFSNSKLR